MVYGKGNHFNNKTKLSSSLRNDSLVAREIFENLLRLNLERRDICRETLVSRVAIKKDG